jgi:hypothetical protein
MEHYLKMFESIVLRIFGTKMDKIIGGWGTLHYEELHNFYSSLYIYV